MVRDRHPNTVRLILSGAADIQDITQAMVAGAIYKFLTKPIDPALLRANVAEAFSRAASLRATVTADVAARDPATGLPTHGYLKRIFPSVVADARSDGGSVCVLVIRVDQFPSIVGKLRPSLRPGVREGRGRGAEPRARAALLPVSGPPRRLHRADGGRRPARSNQPYRTDRRGALLPSRRGRSAIKSPLRPASARRCPRTSSHNSTSSSIKPTRPR